MRMLKILPVTVAALVASFCSSADIATKLGPDRVIKGVCHGKLYKWKDGHLYAFGDRQCYGDQEFTLEDSKGPIILQGAVMRVVADDLIAVGTLRMNAHNKEDLSYQFVDLNGAPAIRGSYSKVSAWRDGKALVAEWSESAADKPFVGLIDRSGAKLLNVWQLAPQRIRQWDESEALFSDWGKKCARINFAGFGGSETFAYIATDGQNFRRFDAGNDIFWKLYSHSGQALTGGSFESVCDQSKAELDQLGSYYGL